jgi:hypothetical protein
MAPNAPSALPASTDDDLTHAHQLGGRVCLRSIAAISLHCGLDDLAAGHGHFEPVGSAPTLMKQLDHEEWLLAKFFFVPDPDGCKIEVIQHDDRDWI